MSKEFRRVLSLVFVLALMLSLALPACAEGSIRESEPQEDAAEADAPVEEGSISGEDAEAAPQAPAYLELYVSAAGDDMADGSREAPLASLAAAADLANAASESTVYVILLSDLTVTRVARFNGKNVILMSEEGTALVTRGSIFETAYDAVRRAYNPAMIELGELQSAAPKSTSLSVDNVVLDDAGLHEGSEFLAQSGEAEVNNLERVQDAIVALYGSSRLTLNPGSELRNFGGMSAVRAVGAASVTVEDYSAIKDTAAIASPAGLKAIDAAGAEVKIGTYASVIERSAAPAEAAEPAQETSDETDEAGAAPAEEAEKSASETDDVPFLAQSADAAEPQDAEEGSGDEGSDEEPGSNWDNIIKGLTDIISEQLPELSPDFIQSLLNGFSPEYLSDLFKQLTEGGSGEGGSGGTGNIADIIGDLIGGSGGSNVDIPGINTGSSSTLSFTAPASLVEGEDGPPYQVPYKASVTLPSSLVTVIKFMGVDRVESGRIKLAFKLDSRLDAKPGEDGKYCSVTGNIFEISEESYSEADKSLSVVLTFKDGWKDHGDELGETINLNFASELPDSKFDPEAEKLVSTAKLENFYFQVASRPYKGDSEVELKAETKMLSSEGAWLTYDINGGEGGPDPNPVFAHEESGYALEKENVPTHIDMNKKPVVFLGWTAEKDENIYERGGTAPETLSTVDIKAGEDRTVYAVYSFDENEDGIPDVNQRLVQLSFDPNGGSGEPDPILALAVANVGASIDIPEQEPFLKYYTFQGWSEDAGATEAKYKHDAAKKADQDILITKDTVLYAVWKENPTYTLYYNANGGSGAPAAQSGISDENGSVELTIASGQPSRSGYSFLGWSVSRGGAASYFAGNKVKITGGNVTLYAVWQKGGSSYNGGGSSTTAPKTGDEAPIALYAALAVISLGAVGVGAWLLLRNQKRKK